MSGITRARVLVDQDKRSTVKLVVNDAKVVGAGTRRVQELLDVQSTAYSRSCRTGPISHFSFLLSYTGTSQQVQHSCSSSDVVGGCVLHATLPAFHYTAIVLYTLSLSLVSSLKCDPSCPLGLPRSCHQSQKGLSISYSCDMLPSQARALRISH